MMSCGFILSSALRGHNLPALDGDQIMGWALHSFACPSYGWLFSLRLSLSSVTPLFDRYALTAFVALAGFTRFRCFVFHNGASEIVIGSPDKEQCKYKSDDLPTGFMVNGRPPTFKLAECFHRLRCLFTFGFCASRLRIS